MKWLMKNKESIMKKFIILFLIISVSFCLMMAEQDFDKLLKKAKKGDAEAQGEVGYMYLNGKGVDKNLINAHKWFKKSANKGYPKAQFYMWALGKTGISGEEGKEKANDWLIKSAENDFPKAQLTLASFYSEGRYFEKNKSKAKMWLDKLINNEKASEKMKKTAKMYMISKDLD